VPPPYLHQGATRMDPEWMDERWDETKEHGKRVTRRVGFAGQTGDAGSAARRESARKNTGRNEREGASAGATDSSGVDSSAGVGPVSPVAVAEVTCAAVVNG